MKKNLNLLFFIIALIATFAVAHPSPHQSDSKEIHVTSPGPGPWAIKSSQNVSWWSLHISNDGKILYTLFEKFKNFITTNKKTLSLNKIEIVKVEIICKDTGEVVWTGEVSNRM